MVIVKATAESEAGKIDPAAFEKMGTYNEELVKAGIMLEGEGLQPSAKGKRVKFSGTNRIVTDGPFAETRELIAGFWIWKVKSIEEAVEWLKRAPFGDGVELEIRPMYETEELVDELMPELRERNERLRADVAKLRQS
ncbi:MAG TPA: YciI family protein [Pyrinomonadaceae bacterium]